MASSIREWRRLGGRQSRATDRFILGAAIGSGMTAQAAERAGADILLALNAGRLRAMGVASPASTLPIRDSNALVTEFARTEILPRTTLPVLFGACAFDPRIDLPAFVDRLARWGFAGITNFPSVIHLDDARRNALERTGLGYEREIRLLALAQDRGLLALGYTRSAAEARCMAEAGVVAICMNFALNSGHGPEAEPGIGIAEVAARSGEIARIVRSVNRNAICLLGGGPITTPDELLEACREVGTQGFVGGSTLDRVPLEHSMLELMAGFKIIHVLRKRVDALERQLQRAGYVHGIVAQAASMNRALQAARSHAEAGVPVLLTGEPGTGKRVMADLVHRLGRRKHQPPMVFSCADWNRGQMVRDLFGMEVGAGGKTRLSALEAAGQTSLVLLHVERLPLEAQDRLAEFLETGRFRRNEGLATITSSANIIATAALDVRSLVSAGAMSPSLARFLEAHQVTLPPLRERIEDLLLLVRHFLKEFCPKRDASGIELENSALRVLMDHHWPGNVRELRGVIERLSAKHPSGRITADAVEPLLTVSSAKRDSVLSEREWIIDALKRNKLHRGRTAQFLGISRKTLYNKIQRYKIFG